MRKCLVLLVTSAWFSWWTSNAAVAASIRVTVVENQSGHFLGHAQVALTPVAGTQTVPQSFRSNSYGVVQFSALPSGAYVITASRRGFASVQSGQKQWRSSGFPVMVSENEAQAITIRLPRLGAITGTVRDEDDVGMPEYDVVAYRNTRPPQPIARARSDDRGMYRLYGLKPGSYLVGSAAIRYEDSEYIPTFSRETQIPDQALAVDVNLDQQVDQVDVRPMTGRLYTLKVDIKTVPERPTEFLPVTVTIASSLGRETVQGNSHQFGNLPPGPYELFVQAPLERGAGLQGYYEKINLSQNKSVVIVLQQVIPASVKFEGPPGQGAGADSIPVLARRVDLAGEGAPELLKVVNGRAQLAAGPWQLAIPASPDFFVSAFSAPAYRRPPDGRAEGWNEIGSVSNGSIVFTLSSNAGAVSGTVRTGGDPVSGAPVFLEPLDLEPRRRVDSVLVTRSDLRGHYRFSGLAPGNYRVLSSFEYQMPDSQTMSNAGAKGIRVDAGFSAQQDLDLYLIQ